MPTYEYKCANCGHALEAFQSIQDKELKKCPKCNKNTLKKQIGTGCGIIFKGAGFYITDYARKGCVEAPSKDAPCSANKADSAKPKSPACAACEKAGK